VLFLFFHCPGIRHFSGTAIYEKEFSLSQPEFENAGSVYLNLGRVESFAEISLNGKDLGILWKQPYEIEITEVIKPGKNEVEIKITNTWWNRLIGDEIYSEGFPGSEVNKPRTSVTHKAWTKEDELLPAGLLGPVKVTVYD